MQQIHKIERGVRQGCIVSPDLLNLYSEAILRELEILPEFLIDGHNLIKADDTVLIADTEYKPPTRGSTGEREERD